MSLDHAMNLEGLLKMGQEEKIEFDLTIEDVADMMDEDNTVITTVWSYCILCKAEQRGKVSTQASEPYTWDTLEAIGTSVRWE